MPKKLYASVAWTPEDLQSVRPYWTVDMCRAWLVKNEKYVQERIVELGWEVLQDLSFSDTTAGDRELEDNWNGEPVDFS